MADVCFGVVIWQIFSTDPEESTVVGEIMDFSALLVLIQLDDFLMNTATQQFTKSYYEKNGGFLNYEFNYEEISMIIEQINDQSGKSCCELFWDAFERVIRFIFSYVIFGAIVLINLHYMEDPFGQLAGKIRGHWDISFNS